MILLTEAEDKFIKWGASKYSPRTLYTYRKLVERFVDYMKDCQVEQVRLDDLNDYYSYLKHLRLADSSIAYHMIALRQFWKLMYKGHYTAVDYELINVPHYTSNSYPPKGQQVANTLLEAVHGEDLQAIRDRLIISFLADSGVRVSELCDLQITDMRIADRYAVIISKKNRKRRRIFWSERTEVYLAQYLGEWRELKKSDSVFISLGRQCPGERITTRSVERIITYYAKIAGLGWVTPHMFRHGLGEDLAKQKVHPRHMQEILGHLNITGSQTYLDVADPDLKFVYTEFAANR